MATITVNATQDGYLWGPASGTFSGARNPTDASLAFANSTGANQESIAFTKAAGPRGTTYYFRRSAFGFNVTSYSSDTITNAFLQIRTTTSGTNLANTVYMVPFSGFGATLGSTLAVGDWSNYTLGTSWGSASIVNTASTQTITLNSTGIAAFTTGYVKIGAISNVDYQNSDPASTVTDDTWINWSHSDNAQLIFDQASSGYGNIVNAVAAASIGSINTVPAADITNVIGV